MRIAIASQNERKIPCAKESEQSQIHLHFLGLFLGDLFEISLQALDFTCWANLCTVGVTLFRNQYSFTDKVIQL